MAKNPTKIKEFPPCTHSDCAAYEDGVCLALIDNKGYEEKCPFFKTKEQNQKECEECALRAIRGKK